MAKKKSSFDYVPWIMFAFLVASLWLQYRKPRVVMVPCGQVACCLNPVGREVVVVSGPFKGTVGTYDEYNSRIMSKNKFIVHVDYLNNIWADKADVRFTQPLD